MEDARSVSVPPTTPDGQSRHIIVLPQSRPFFDRSNLYLTPSIVVTRPDNISRHWCGIWTLSRSDSVLRHFDGIGGLTSLTDRDHSMCLTRTTPCRGLRRGGSSPSPCRRRSSTRYIQLRDTTHSMVLLVGPHTETFHG